MQELTTAPTPAVDRSRRLALLGAGTAVLGAGTAVARGGTVPAPERAVFRLVNDLPDTLYPALWPAFQLGALVAAPAVAAVAVCVRRPRLALAAALATVLKLGGERLVKAAVSRQRPATSIGPDIIARGDGAVLTGGVALGRVYVGAHNPLDVVCGAALGVVIGVAVDTVTRRTEARP